MQKTKFAERFSLGCLAMSCLVIALAIWKPVRAAPEDFPGGLIVDERYSYAADHDVELGKIQTPIGVGLQTHIVDFTASCDASGPDGTPVVRFALRWYPDDLWDSWRLHTAKGEYREKDAAQVRTIMLHTDITNQSSILRVADIRPCQTLAP